MMQPRTIFLIVLAVLVLLTLSIRTVRQYQRGAVRSPEHTKC